MNADERAKRTCSRSWEANVFLDKIIEMADKAEAEGKMITAVIDREGDQVNADSSLRKRVRDPNGKILPGDEFYHHRRSLQRDGISDDEIRQREIFDRQLRKSWRKKKPEQKIRDYYAFQAQRAKQGLLPSSCHIIQVAIVEDDKDECTFILQATRLVETEYGGERRLMPKFGQFLTHPAMCSTNVSMNDDLAHIINAFYGGCLVGVKYAEMEDVMADRWGRNCERSALDMFHRAFPELTWPKDVMIAMGHWWVKKLTPKQTGYAFSDVNSLKKVLNATNDDATHPISHFCVTFPDRRISNRPSGISICLDDFASDAALVVSKPARPDWFLPVCQETAKRFPEALLPCSQPLEIHFLFRHLFGMWKDSEKERIREMTTGSSECDWNDIDSEPTDPNRFKSTRDGFEEYLNTMIDNINADQAGTFSSREALDKFLFGAEENSLEQIENDENIALKSPWTKRFIRTPKMSLWRRFRTPWTLPRNPSLAPRI